MVKHFKFLKYYPTTIGLSVILIYYLTVGRSIGEFDSGELALAQATLSIPHPTGYPLFSLIGFIFSKVPLPFPTLIKLNLLNSIWCTLTVVILIKTSKLLLDNLKSILNKKFLELNFQFSIPESHKISVSIFSGLMLAFSATFWLNSTKVEVYSLQIFLTSLIIFNSLEIYIYNGNKPSELNYKTILKDWLLITVLIGLAFSNHLMTIYLLPATVVLYFFKNKINKQSIQAFLILTAIIIFIASVFYLIMMFRAQTSPPWSYGDPSDLQRLYDHITAKEYTKYLLDNSDGLIQQSSKLLKMLSFNFSAANFSFGEFGLSLFLGIAGVILISALKKDIAIYLYLILVVSISTALVYHIPDINEYFLVSFFVISLSSVLPLIMILQIIEHLIIIKRIFFLLLFSLLVLQLIVNYNYANRSEFFVIEDFIKSSIGDLPPNSVLLTDNWGSIISPALYYQNVERLRNDVNIISPSGYIEFDWYRKFKATKIYDSNFVLIPRPNTFVAFDVAYRLISKGILKIPEHYSLIPMRNYFLLATDSNYYPLDLPKRKIRFSKYTFSDSEKYIKELIPYMLEQRLLYELNFNRTNNAKDIYDEIKKRFPDYRLSSAAIMELIKYKILKW
ncbi:Putative membrane protein [Ignavibacterium album JCM 16511]|uniref:Putative membrane protein n=1 Tax=Ignavibacterium album (strain DSM 19864 / JCM 16511 / NBRC 101810 / Mat9-16) TaxID=945713 RepID=I0AH06_IGNAJ|nr:DUF2723 domain-containing protein [Ignavibacterium album]AFH48263.1 Putative membrane protein [Ignavibacterium album JCM 16511]